MLTKAQVTPRFALTVSSGPTAFCGVRAEPKRHISEEAAINYLVSKFSHQDGSESFSLGDQKAETKRKTSKRDMCSELIKFVVGSNETYARYTTLIEMNICAFDGRLSRVMHCKSTFDPLK